MAPTFRGTEASVDANLHRADLPSRQPPIRPSLHGATVSFETIFTSMNLGGEQSILIPVGTLALARIDGEPTRTRAFLPANFCCRGLSPFQ